MVGWSVGWSVGWLVGLLVGWLLGRSRCAFFEYRQELVRVVLRGLAPSSAFVWCWMLMVYRASHVCSFVCVRFDGGVVQATLSTCTTATAACKDATRRSWRPPPPCSSSRRLARCAPDFVFLRTVKPICFSVFPFLFRTLHMFLGHRSLPAFFLRRHRGLTRQLLISK